MNDASGDAGAFECDRIYGEVHLTLDAEFDADFRQVLGDGAVLDRAGGAQDLHGRDAADGLGGFGERLIGGIPPRFLRNPDQVDRLDDRQLLPLSQSDCATAPRLYRGGTSALRNSGLRWR